jgi:hypothetical protein
LAVADLRRSVELRRELVESYPDEPEYRKGLAGSYNILSIFLREKEPQSVEALDLDRRSVELQLGLAAERPDDPDVLAGLAISFNNLMIRLPKTARVSRATMNEQAVALGEAASRQRPEDLAMSRNAA